MDTLVKIDGSYGEGGGQIIRTSLSLSALTGKPVEVANVRAKRSKPGLQPQHLTAVNAAARICNAQLEGAEVGSRGFVFRPSSPVQPGHYNFDIGTAGATSLVMQTVMIPLALSGGTSQVTVQGGTHVPHAPTANYLEHVYVALMRDHGLTTKLAVPAGGFFPRGGGKIEATIEASTLSTINRTERGRLRQLTAYIVTSGLPEAVGQRGAMAAEKALKGFRKPEVVIEDLPSRGQGASVVVVAECDGVRTGFSAIGERGKSMERVVDEACDLFAEWYRTGAVCDEHLADQFVLPAALVAASPSYIPGEARSSEWTTSAVTEHLRTVLWLCRHFLDIDTHLTENADGTGHVRVSR